VPRVFVPLAAAMNECVDLVCGAGDGGIVPSTPEGRLEPPRWMTSSAIEIVRG